MHGAIVKFNALPDADRSGAENQDLLPVCELLFCLVLFLLIIRVDRIIIWRLCRKLRRAGIDHLVDCGDAERGAARPHLLLVQPRQTRNRAVRVPAALGLEEQLLRQQLLCLRLAAAIDPLCRDSAPCLLELCLDLHEMRDLVDEPLVDHRDLMNRAVRDALAQRLRDHPDALVVDHGEPREELLLGKTREIVAVETFHMLLQRADGLHERAFKIVADTHDLAGRLHLCGQRALGRDELIKRQAREFDDAVIERGLEAGEGLARNRIADLVECIAERDLGRHLGDRISRRLRGERGGTRHTGIDLDDTVLKARRMQRKLNIAAAGDTELVDDIQRRRAEHLILLV